METTSKSISFKEAFKVSLDSIDFDIILSYVLTNNTTLTIKILGYGVR